MLEVIKVAEVGEKGEQIMVFLMVFLILCCNSFLWLWMLSEPLPKNQNRTEPNFRFQFGFYFQKMSFGFLISLSELNKKFRFVPKPN